MKNILLCLLLALLPSTGFSSCKVTDDGSVYLDSLGETVWAGALEEAWANRQTRRTEIEAAIKLEVAILLDDPDTVMVAAGNSLKARGIALGMVFQTLVVSADLNVIVNGESIGALVAVYTDNPALRDIIEFKLDDLIDATCDTNPTRAKEMLAIAQQGNVYVRPALVDKVNAL